jgi:hypothetical protein
MRLILAFLGSPTPALGDTTDDGLTALVDGDVLDRDFLLPAGPVSLQLMPQKWPSRRWAK